MASIRSDFHSRVCAASAEGGENERGDAAATGDDAAPSQAPLPPRHWDGVIRCARQSRVPSYLPRPWSLTFPTNARGGRGGSVSGGVGRGDRGYGDDDAHVPARARLLFGIYFFNDSEKSKTTRHVALSGVAWFSSETTWTR